MKLRHRAFSLAVLLAATSLGLAPLTGCSAEATDDAAASSSDAVSRTERAAIMDALRAVVKPELANQDIVFDVSQGTLRVKDGWCWLQGQIVLRSGGEPTTAGTAYEEEAEAGLFDGFRIEALLKKEGDAWKVEAHGIGSTDVWYWGLEESYPAAPPSIFPWLDAADQATEDARAERRAVMDALRATVKPSLANQDIVFDVSDGVFAMEGGYCWLQGEIQLRGGGEPTTRGTAYAELAEDGLFDGFRVEALLQKEGGAWKVLEHGVGSTDVWYSGIEARHPGAPRSLFPWL